mmetsp:Transcript_24544/g.52877  ORF Transcript_24544/g.52877 Transcript_24544/m.52877 type:complete len:908 (+) Transcript_24544:126-2849(+)
MTYSLAIITVLLSLAITDVVAFSTPSRAAIKSPSTTALCMSKGTANNNKGQQKKRRFLQQAHPESAAPKVQAVQEQPKSSPKVESQSNGKSNAIIATTNGNKENKSITDNLNYSNTYPKKRRSPPLRTSQSLEELEAILEKRYGTASAGAGVGKKMTAEEGVDFELSFGDDDDGDDNDDDALPKKASNKNGAAATSTWKSAFYNDKNNKLKKVPKRGPNRVLDPWAEEDGIYDDDSDDDDDSDRSENENLLDFGKRNKNKPQQEKYNRQEAMLNRVRTNQERLQSTKQQVDNGKKKKKNGVVADATVEGERGGSGKKDVINVPIDVSKDYYDEDDEGYDESSSSLLSPRPVGGKGSFSKDSSSSSSSLSGGIFSDRSSTNTASNQRKRREAINALEEAETKKKRPKQKAPKGVPLLDDEGNEMFLTLEQADRIVQGILSSEDGAATDGVDKEEEEEKTTWEEIGITNPTLLSNLNAKQMSCPAPLAVQDRACPPIVAGNDVLISTHTGSGKTLAFLAPIAQNLLMAAEEASSANPNNKQKQGAFPKAIVIAPGRELASQIVSVAQTLFECTGLTVALAIGGTPYARTVEKLRKKKPDVVVGSPGRIAELMIGRPGEKGGKLKISGLQTIVLDEFDALLSYDSHTEPTMAIMQALDRQHGQNLQRVLCSATASDMMTSSSDQQGEEEATTTTAGSSMIEQYLRPGYAHACVDDSDLLVTSGVQTKTKGGGMTTSARVSRTTLHGALHVPHQRFALEAVRKVLNTEPIPQQVLIFVDSPRRVDIVIEKLAGMDIIAAPLHGGATSGKGDRAQVNKALRDGYVGIVVATEMAARGIDAPYLTHVINLDLPTDASHYAHRAGRCGRGGRPGVAVSITCDGREKSVPKRFAEELGIAMYNVEAREAKLRIVE